MLTLGNSWQIVTSNNPNIEIGTIVYWQKKAVGEPLGLLLCLTSSGVCQKAIKTSSGLVAIN